MLTLRAVNLFAKFQHKIKLSSGAELRKVISSCCSLIMGQNASREDISSDFFQQQSAQGPQPGEIHHPDRHACISLL